MSVQSAKKLIDRALADLAKRGQVYTAQDVEAVLIDCIGLFEIEEVAPEESRLDYLNLFCQAKEVEGRTPKTVERYRYIVTKLLKSVAVPETSITIYHLRKYFSEQKARGVSDSSLEGERAVFSAYFGWLMRERLITANPCDNLAAIKHVKKVRKPYTLTDMERIKDACKTLRDKALVMFLASSGCRVNEVCSLDRDAVNLIAKECVVLGKGNKERTVYINDVAVLALNRYLESRKDDSPALFVGKGSARITPGGVRAALKRIEAASGVENVHPHRFRRTLATNLINRGMPIQEVAAILGHDKIDTTMTYVYIESGNVKSSYSKYA